MFVSSQARCSVIRLLLIAFSAIAFGSYGLADSGIPPEAHRLFSPLPLIHGFQDAEIAIGNRTDHEIDATLTLYAADGHEIVSQPIQFGVHEAKLISLPNTLKGADISEVKSVSVSYFGVFRSLAAQVTLLRFQGGASVDATLYEDGEFYSPEYNAVWWQPTLANAYIAIANSTSTPQQLTFAVGAGHSELVSLAAHSTAIKDAGALVQPSGEGAIGDVHISTSAPLGAIRATAFSATSDGSYVNTVRFLDPGASKSASLFATGISIEDSDYHLLVKNLTAQEISLSGRVFLSIVGGTDKSALIVKPQTLKPNEVSSVRIEEESSAHLRDAVAVQLTSSGGHSSFAASLGILYRSAPLLSASVPFRDVSTEESATGGYPWRLDGDFQSRIYITNTQPASKVVFAMIFPSDGPVYTIGRRVLTAGETAVFDIGRLRDEQVPDDFGKKLSVHANSGQFVWGIEAGQTDDHGLLGRAVVVSKQLERLSSFGCFSCSCGYGIDQLSISDANPHILTGSSESIITYGGEDSPCNGNPYKRVTLSPSWANSNPTALGIAAGDPSIFTGLTEGSIPFSAGYGGSYITFNQGSCTTHNEQLTANGTATVGPAASLSPDHLQVNSDNTTVYLCAIGTSRRRAVNYNVIATDGTIWNRAMSALETVDPSTISSCTSTQVPTSYLCTPLPSGTGNFSDGLNPECPSTKNVAQGCGFVFPDQVWEWCKPLGSPVPLANIGTDRVLNTSISLGGNTTKFPIGTTFPK